MANSSIIQINIRKSHVIALTLVILTATTAATVNIRDNTNIFQILDMNDNKITNLATPTNSQDAATKNYVDENGNGQSLDWTSATMKSDYVDYNTDSGSASISCNSGEVLRDVSCTRVITPGSVYTTILTECDTLTSSSASISDTYRVVSVKGVCVPTN